MNFTDLFIKRPVLSTVVSLMILLLGLYSIFSLSLREYPKIETTKITVTTNYPGANADLVQGFITQPLASAVGEADGIDYMTTSSTLGSSTITVYMNLNYDANAALSEIMAKVNQVQNQLPSDAQDPTIQKSSADQFALMYLGYKSATMTPEQVTDYLSRVIQPNLQTLDGVSQAQILGGKTFSMRIWLNPIRMIALGVSATDVSNALTQNNYQSAAGQTKGDMVIFNVSADTDLHDQKKFENIVVKSDGDTLIRMSDIARVELGSQSYDSSVTFNGESAVFLGVYTTPEGNPLVVSDEVKEKLPDLAKNYPEGLSGKIVYDGSRYIESSTEEVIETIAITSIIVIIVIFAFLGSFRSVFIPVITMPLSMVGVCFFMLMLGYSLNLLTLLAMVLAIGLVVDDAIVVVENIYRHIEEGKSPMEAALIGAREITSPVISMTITLAAVYAPIGFMGGLTGQLFTEFAFTLAGAVIISGVIALTLSPMMCSKLLNRSIMESPLVQKIDAIFDGLRVYYEKKLIGALHFRPVTVVFAVIILSSCYFLTITAQSELAPKEDQSALWAIVTGPKYANIDYMNKFTQPFNDIFEGYPEMEDSFIINGNGTVNSGMGGLILKPWDERSRSQAEVKAQLQPQVDQMAGVKAVVFEPPSLPGNSSGLPVQLVLKTTGSFELLYSLQQQIEEKAKASGLFAFTDTSLTYNNPQLNVTIDREKAGNMGINMQQVGQQLSLLLGSNYVNWFSMQNRSYQVIPQVDREFRYNPDDINQYYVSTASGDLIPLSTIVTITSSIQPNELDTFQQLNSATVSGVMVPGNTIDDGINFLRTQAEQILPKGVTYDFAGESRQTVQEGNSLVLTFFFALVVIYLVLAAKFESWRDPIVILISVPMSICGALIPLNMGFSTLNIYSSIGLVTLIGLISKHGILMVEFANLIQRDEKLSLHDAIVKSATLRLRPILMTTFAMVFGVMPLLFASGAGAKSRFDIGLVICTGMTIGTLFTLFVVPTMYTFLANNHAEDHFD